MKYVYEVISDRPMSAYVGIGNLAVLTFSSNSYNAIAQRDRPVIVASNGAATGAGTFTVELKERVEERKCLRCGWPVFDHGLECHPGLTPETFATPRRDTQPPEVP
ncbi:hypothetical protein QEO77_gp39 [Arthrobacter phage Zaheer]|uniref:Uncharacterized protein n=1 Tax=Arthrobacter phage Zaheer TaxID=2836041 RepID=A0A8F3IPP2_9CAUD|nr:hypothetical protein QEO77_gp39 [Arthrobacter phage Zaheer]QWY84264.1 hypothetical protein SEA_ZAHEER_68 [Arthrobacter phage Zaheer]